MWSLTKQLLLNTLLYDFINEVSLFQKKFANTAESCNKKVKFRSQRYKNCYISYKFWDKWTKICIDEDMNAKDMSKFSSAEDDHKLKYVQKS